MTFNRYTKRPVTISAKQFTDPESANDIIQYILDHDGNASFHCSDPTDPDDRVHTIRIRTLEGEMDASLNDWVIEGLKGEFYPCKPDIFYASYDLPATKDPR